MENQEVPESLEESIFKTLSHQKRRDILRVIGEKKTATFTEIKKAVSIEDSPSLSYHLNALNGLVLQKEGEYQLTILGQDAYDLICKTAFVTRSTSMIASLKKLVPAVIVINAALWATALLLTGQLEGKLQQGTIFGFAALWIISNGVLYSLLSRIRRSETLCLLSHR